VTEDDCQINEEHVIAEKHKEIILKTPETETQPMPEESTNAHNNTDIVPKPEPEHVTPESELKEEDFPRPPMSSELLIAIAVRNLDPDKNVGASCLDIVAFLSLHFPYFNNHFNECKEMVRRECGFEKGKENFQMEAEINCGDRIHTYVQKNRDKICQSMLEPEFLDIIVERFANENVIIRPKERKLPPFDNKMLTHIALLKTQRSTTLEQIVILLKFVFPALGKASVIDAFRKEFLEVVAKSSEINAKLEESNITFTLKEDETETVLEDIRNCTLGNLDIVGQSLLNDEFFDLILPIFQNSE